MSDIRYWIGLSFVPEIGPVMARRLLALMGSPEQIFRAGLKDLLEIKGLGREKAESIKNFGLWDTVEKRIKILEKKGIRAIPCNDSAYPEVLRELEGAPVVLYMKGDYIPEDRYGIAVVGSRKHTPYGEVVAQKLSGDLASAGFTIVSGMARGIDTLSHKAALAAEGRTIAVLGSGIDVCYPAENRGLAEKIPCSGCLISEFPPGTIPGRENFPRRNRLISGLSLGVLIVEATADSGSLITAQYALEQNKEVFAVPGKITSPNSEGTNSLIRQGARIVLDADDIIEELAPVLRGFIRAKAGKAADLSEEEGSICTALSREPKHIDILSRETALPVQKMLELLLSLELKGIVRQSGGKRFYLS
ncbi:MAG: DNA-protecting protein DprA [Nitrospirae bacterium]|nr:DNA-protecting protein DprA [Nitrospirota bacterium]